MRHRRDFCITLMISLSIKMERKKMMVDHREVFHQRGWWEVEVKEGSDGMERIFALPCYCRLEVGKLENGQSFVE